MQIHPTPERTFELLLDSDQVKQALWSGEFDEQIQVASLRVLASSHRRSLQRSAAGMDRYSLNALSFWSLKCSVWFSLMHKCVAASKFGVLD